LSINSEYFDVGFGSNVIDYNIAPFSNIQTSEQYTAEGFGHSESTIANNDSYKNNKTLNFGSQNVSVFKNLIKYEYEEIYEKGNVKIEKNSFKKVKIKNKNIFDPIFVCTPNKLKISADVSINVEKLSSTEFKVFNSCNIDITADYIASFTVTKKTTVNFDQFKVDNLNKKIKEFLYA